MLKRKIDEEWLALIVEAKKAGLSIEEIKKFLASAKEREQEE